MSLSMVRTAVGKKVAALPSAWQALPVILAIASFALYAEAVLALHQERAAGWGIEAQGPIPAALSHLLYGTPLGAVDNNLLTRFSPYSGAKVQDAITAAVAGSIPHGDTVMYTLDGNGLGENLFATLAMWMFGFRIASLIWFYLTFVGISALAFVCRYRDRRLIVVPLYFLAVTVMLLTPLSMSPQGVDQNAIGGIRYFALAAFLPALHIYFELLDRTGPPRWGAWIFHSALLLIQGLLLFAAFLVRSSTGYVLGVLLLALAWRFYHDHAARGRLIPLGCKTAIVGTALAFWVIFVVAAMPAYVHSGRVFSLFWHRAFISFASHPAWPFGDLRKVYDCTKYIPEGLSQEAGDRNGHCIWFAYLRNAAHPGVEVGGEVYDGNYEKVLRNAFFYVLAHYPRQAFELYFHIKPQEIKDTLTQAWSYLLELDRAPAAKSMFLLIAGQLLVFVLFVMSTALVGLRPIGQEMIVFPLLFLLSLAPRFVAWASWMTSADLILLMYGCMALAAVLVAQFAFFSIRQLIQPKLAVGRRQLLSPTVSGRHSSVVLPADPARLP
jgi:hypothetical protein